MAHYGLYMAPPVPGTSSSGSGKYRDKLLYFPHLLYGETANYISVIHTHSLLYNEDRNKRGLHHILFRVDHKSAESCTTSHTISNILRGQALSA